MNIDYDDIDTGISVLLGIGILILCIQLWWDSYKND
jgi:hypothetical protein